MEKVSPKLHAEIVVRSGQADSFSTLAMTRETVD